MKNWIHFWWGWNFDLSYEICGYFDNRPRINICLVFFHLTVILPFWNKWIDECDPPKWGIGYHNKTMWLYIGGKGNLEGGKKWKTAYMPWMWDLLRTSTLLTSGAWYNETIGNRMSWFSNTNTYGTYEWLKKNKHIEVYDFTYILNSGKTQNRKASIGVSEREYRWHWFKWLPLIKSTIKCIDVEFNDEVGERTGSWKGGTVGCSYVLLPNETPLQCLKRMEKECKFNS
jgi:hypothetical protein